MRTDHVTRGLRVMVLSAPAKGSVGIVTHAPPMRHGKRDFVPQMTRATVLLDTGESVRVMPRYLRPVDHHGPQEAA